MCRALCLILFEIMHLFNKIYCIFHVNICQEYVNILPIRSLALLQLWCQWEIRQYTNK